MTRKVLTSLGWIFALALVLVVAGCVPKSPPFNANGTYSGTWGDGGAGPQCDMSATIGAQTGQLYPYLWSAWGAFTFDFGCVDLPDELEPYFSLEPAYVDLSGALTEYGQISYLSGGCDTAACAFFSLDGRGADTDADWLMDTYSGTVTLTIALAGIPAYNMTGYFSVERDDEVLAWENGFEPAITMPSETFDFASPAMDESTIDDMLANAQIVDAF